MYVWQNYTERFDMDHLVFLLGGKRAPLDEELAIHRIGRPMQCTDDYRLFHATKEQDAETHEKFGYKGSNYSGRELSMMFGVKGFPTTVFIDSNGDLITSVSGFIPPDRFNLILKYLAEKWYEKMKFDAFLQQENSKS